MKKKILISFTTIILLILFLFILRLTSPIEIDDVSPEISCSQKYLKQSDVLWIIPKFNNQSISENKEWCNYILSLNKTLGLHGVYHDFNEFDINRNQEYLQQGINIFKECFGIRPTTFKPPQLKINEYNKKLIKENKIDLKGKINQLTHKVYHCEDTGLFPNWVVEVF